MNIFQFIKLSPVNVIRLSLCLGAWWPEGRSSSSVSQFLPDLLYTTVFLIKRHIFCSFFTNWATSRIYVLWQFTTQHNTAAVKLTEINTLVTFTDGWSTQRVLSVSISLPTQLSLALLTQSHVAHCHGNSASHHHHHHHHHALQRCAVWLSRQERLDLRFDKDTFRKALWSAFLSPVKSCYW